MGKGKKETNEAATAVAELRAGASAHVRALQIAFANVTSGEHEIPLCLIKESLANPRTQFDAEKLNDLTDTLLDADIGLVKPITVYRLKDPADGGQLFEIEDGARRFRSLKQANAVAARCLIVQQPKNDAVSLARRVIANGMGEDLNPIERGEAYAKILKDCGGDAKKAAIRAGLGAHGSRVLLQEIQFVTALIAPAIDALRDGRITRAHAALICRRKSSKDQRRALDMCFEARPIFNGTTAENEEILISEKELRGKIASHWQDEGEQQKQGALDLAGGSENSAAKDKNDIEREAQQNMEHAADQILESAGGEQGQKSLGSDGEAPVEAPASPSPVKPCVKCGEPSVGIGRGGDYYCASCHRKDSLAAAAKGSDDDDADEPQTETDYEKLGKERLARVGKAFDALPVVTQFNVSGLRMLARMICPPMPNALAVERMYGAGLILVSGNRYEWKNGGGTLQQFIDHLADEGDEVKMYRLILVLMYLPSVNPQYSDEDLQKLERSIGVKKAKAEKKKSIKLPKISAKAIERGLKRAAKESKQISKLSKVPQSAGKLAKSKSKPKAKKK